MANGGSGTLPVESTLGVVASELLNGLDVVIPDAEGPQSQFAVTVMEGHAVLDSVRAAERFAPAQLHAAATRVAMFGYSGGGIESDSANELQPTYAPELNIVGVATGGGAPLTADNISAADGSPFVGIEMAAFIGVDRAYPYGLYSLLSDKGKVFYKQASTGCATSEEQAPFAHFNDWTNTPSGFQLPQVARVIDRNALGKHTPTAPTFNYHEINDELTGIKAMDDLVAGYCARGATIDYNRDPVGDHVVGAAHFAALALAYLNDRFAGRPAPNNCPPHATPQAGSARETLTLSIRSAKLRGHMLTVRLRLSDAARLSFAVRRSTRTAATATPRLVNAGSRTLLTKLSKRPARGRSYTIRITARRGGERVTESTTLRVSRPSRG